MNAVVNEGTAETAAASGKAATTIEKVTMTDGRVVEFSGKRKLLKESTFPEDGSPPIVILDFRNGETRSFQIPSELLFKAAAHGAEQKLGDETAGVDDIDDMVLAVDDLIGRLSKLNTDGSFAGEWTAKREGSGMSGTSVLMKALIEYSGKTKEAISEFLKSKSAAEKMALRNSAKLKPIVERLESEKLSKAAKVDTDALLAGLGTEEAVTA